MIKFLFYEGRHGERHLTKHSKDAWEFLRSEMDHDNRCTLDEIARDFGPDAIYGSLDYHTDAYLSVDDGGSITTIELTPVPAWTNRRF